MVVIMKNRKKFVPLFILVIATFVCCATVTAFALAPTFGEKVIDESCGPDSYPLNDTPDVIYKDNSEILTATQQSNIDNVDVISSTELVDEMTVSAMGGEVISTEYMTYSSFLSEISHASNRIPQVDDNRVLLVVQIYYPDGYEHIRVGLIENCLATSIYDAETGDYLGCEYSTVEDGESIIK